MLVRVRSKTVRGAVAGIVMEDGVCVETADILGWCLGKTRDELLAMFEERGLVATVVVRRPELDE